MGINRNANLAMLTMIADRLGALREKLVFLGGCTTGLLVTDPAAPDVRATMDVDMIVEAAASLEFHAVEAGMRDRGFQPDMESGIRCRWRSGDIIVDLMPDDESILGFSNRWYSDAIRHAVEENLSSGIMIRRVTAPYFIATKIEAFIGRGKGDFMVSHDFEDIVTVIDGREELGAEIAASEDSVRQFIGRTFAQWMENPDLYIALAGHLPPDPDSQRRYDLLERRFREIASIK